MKYIKTYKLFESDDIIKNISDMLNVQLHSDIEDILLDVKDQGYDVSIKFGSKAPIQVEISSYSRIRNTFYEDISETVDRLRSYIENNSNLILSDIDLFMFDYDEVKTKTEYLKGSRMISNCIDYFHTFSKRTFSEDRYKLHSINLWFKQKRN